MSYDKNGNRTSDGKFTYTWDAEDNLTAVTKKRRRQAVRNL
ncbi:cell wall-associated protein [Bacillus atrophaeus]|nr:cell wall-associated protein [Bacillus atrophaeus]MCY9105981.1 cell wall-associated protein [Bacillus atrophaeus]MED4799318.1 cell wall-associated protein [Bacillus atrophaeus]